MAKVTLKVLAKLLGLSTSTVSKALKDYADIKPETKQRVEDLARRLHYTPNAFAQSLRSSETKIIGLLVPDLVHHIFSAIVDGVIHEAAKHGYLVIVLQSHESYEEEIEKLQLLVNRNIDGILLSLSDNTIKYDHIIDIIKNGMPVVLFDRISRLIECSMVVIDDRKAAYSATEHLIKTGCKKIAHITGPFKAKTTIDRYMGYKLALEKHQLSFDKSLIYTSKNLSFEDGYHLADQLIEEHPDVDGVFAFIDPVAIGVLKAFLERKIDVPQQVSVIGFSNWFLTDATSPALTTIDHSPYDMGTQAFQLLLNQLQHIKTGKAVTYNTVEIPTRILYRNSTKTLQA